MKVLTIRAIENVCTMKKNKNKQTKPVKPNSKDTRNK